jgi:osmotically-inducible protein OsmY
MRRLIPALCLSGLLLACAHDKSERDTSVAKASGEERGSDAADKRGRDAADEQRRERHARADADRVENPELTHRGDRGRVASADGVPERDPGNSEVNDRDRDGSDITPMDQGNGEIDLDLTQRIRKSVVGDDSLSFGAKNVKIITRDGHVTLRGTVNNAAEKDTIYKTAVTHAGVGHVTNQLEVDD